LLTIAFGLGVDPSKWQNKTKLKITLEVKGKK
jgi:hypothetical protein